MKMIEIKIISFDMEGTLIDHKFSNRIWESEIPRLFAEKKGLSSLEAREKIFRDYAEIGVLRPEWYDVGYWFKKYGLQKDWKSLLTENKNYCNLYPEVKGVLERLEKNFELIITSNTIREFLEIQIGCVGNYFSHVFSAPSDFKEVKNSTDFYKKICEAMFTDPKNMAHVGDHIKFDYQSAKSSGINAFLLDRSGEEKGEHVVTDLVDFEEKISML